LKTLLLGSTAAIFAGGAATTASAADATGLVVATMQNQANYVEYCGGDDGFMLKGLCIEPIGQIRWEATWGTSITRTFRMLPNPAADENGHPNVDEPTTVTLGTFDPTFFPPTFSGQFGIIVSAGDLEFTLPIWVNGFSGTEDFEFALEYGIFELLNNGLNISPTFGDVDVVLRLRETDNLGWRDAARGDTGADNNVRNWIGVPGFPDMELDLDFGDWDVAFNVGQRQLRGAPVAMAVTNNAGSPFTTFGGELNFEFDVGDNFTILGGADFDRAPIVTAFTVVAGDPAPGNDMITYDPGIAWGANLGFEVEMGALTTGLRIDYGRNFGGYTGYQYQLQPNGNYWRIDFDAEVEIGPATFTTEVIWTDGPQLGYDDGLGPNADRVLAINNDLEIELANVDNVTLAFGLDHERQGFPWGFHLWTATAEIEWEPQDDFVVELLVTHRRQTNPAWFNAGVPGVFGATSVRLRAGLEF
jgi:hypothetical protein